MPESLDLISVIVPVHNVENYLERCVDSIRNQSHSHIQILLVDDGSQDRSGAICDSYAAADQRIQTIHAPWGGLSAARNAGLDLVTGDYLSFIDADDWVSSDYLETLLRELKQSESEVSGCSFQRVDHSPRPWTEQSVCRVIYDPQTVLSAFVGNDHTRLTISVAKLYVAHLWAGIRFPVGRLHEDEFTTFRVLHRSVRTVMTSAPMYFYFQRSTSTIGAGLTPQRGRDMIAASLSQLDYFADIGRQDLVSAARARLFRKHMQFHLWLDPRRDASERDDLLQSMGVVASALPRIGRGARFGWFARAYVRAPGFFGAAYTAARTVLDQRKARGV